MVDEAQSVLVTDGPEGGGHPSGAGVSRRAQPRDCGTASSRSAVVAGCGDGSVPALD